MGDASPSKRVAIVQTGTANIASIVAAFRRLGADVELTADPEVVKREEHVVLPGVGTLGAAFRELEAHRLVTPLRERIRAGRPTLAVCVGLQLLAESSEESPESEGLGILPVRVRRFTSSLPIPQMGWNEIASDDSKGLLETGYAYFANSYRISDPLPPEWRVAHADYGEKFVAAIERGPVLACQFHPELSGAFGQALLGRWLATESRVS